MIAIPNPTIEHCSVPTDLIHLLHSFDACVRAEGAEPVDEVTEDQGDVKAAAETNPPGGLDFRILRVSSPHVLCVNGSRIGRAWTAPAVSKNVFFASV